MVEPLLYGPEPDSYGSYEVDLSPLYGPLGPYAWVRLRGLDVGMHELRVPRRYEGVDVPFEVLPYGRGEGFDRESVVGRVYVMQDPPYLFVPALNDILWQQVGTDHAIRVLSTDGEAARLQIIVQARDQSPCILLEDEAILSSTGELVWEREKVEVDLPNATLLSEDLYLRLGFHPDGETIGGAEVRLTVDTRIFSEALDGGVDYVCDFANAIGSACIDCVGDDEDTCLHLAMHAGTFALDEAPFFDPDENLPLCGFDPDSVEAPSFDWDIDCGCQDGRTSLFLLPLGLLAALRRRR